MDSTCENCHRKKPSDGCNWCDDCIDYGADAAIESAYQNSICEVDECTKCGKKTETVELTGWCQACIEAFKPALCINCKCAIMVTKDDKFHLCDTCWDGYGEDCCGGDSCDE